MDECTKHDIPGKLSDNASVLDFAATPKTADPGAWNCHLLKNPFNQLLASTTSGSTTTYQYDGRGNQVRKTEPGAVTAYTYDSRNVMTEVALPSGQVNRYGYAPEGLRVAMEDSQGARRVLLDGIEEYGEYETSSGTQVSRYDHAPLKADGLLAQASSQGKHHFNTDALGSVTGLTGSSGSLASAYSYDVYGTRTASLEAAGTNWGFTGRRVDGGAPGILYYRARVYDANVGRFSSVDPIGMVGGPNPWLNLYSYVNNRPTFYIDPSGAFAWAPVMDSMTATAIFHPALFLEIMVLFGVLTLTAAQVARKCPPPPRSKETFYRGDSYSRAQKTISVGFVLAGVGTDPNQQLGPGLYMSRDPDTAVPFAIRAIADYGAGALLEIETSSQVWIATLALGGLDNVPLAGGSGLQSFVPEGAPLIFFDGGSSKRILVRY